MNDQLYNKGLEVRRAVVGSSYVDAALSNADAFTMPMQRLVTEVCWGEIWARPGLDRRSRSLLTLGMVAALNMPDELAIHVRGGIANGLTKEEIQECFLQVSAYVGMPAGLACFKVARQVFNEMKL